ncbi:MAG: DUF5602 domain-containing protein, partial [Candidatus Eremiobacteraeota bacterium]|nr:DUF5602 domain-containing protein [Candidatus Eremiobacteraeota bacterium]
AVNKRPFALAISICSALVLGACGESTTVGPQSVTVIGDTKPLGNSSISTFARVDNTGTVTAFGASFGAAALSGLPATRTETILALPAAAVSAGPFTFFTVNWQPQGHPPPGVYDVPHFDFHFYTITDAARMAIPFGPATNPPPAAAVPPGYVSDPVTIPMMGTHYTDSSAPEFHGQAFTATFVYGYYAGAMAFVEPMTALSFLTTKQAYDAAIKQPAMYQKPGLYPTHYSVTFDANSSTYTLTLDRLVRQ